MGEIEINDGPPPCEVLGLFGLGIATTEADLTQLLSDYGTLHNLALVMDNKTHQSRGFAFATFSSIHEAVHAKHSLSGAHMHGRPIRVDYSTTARAHSPTPGVYCGRDKGGGDRWKRVYRSRSLSLPVEGAEFGIDRSPSPEVILDTRIDGKPSRSRRHSPSERRRSLKGRSRSPHRSRRSPRSHRSHRNDSRDRSRHRRGSLESRGNSNSRSDDTKHRRHGTSRDNIARSRSRNRDIDIIVASERSRDKLNKDHSVSRDRLKRERSRSKEHKRSNSSRRLKRERSRSIVRYRRNRSLSRDRSRERIWHRENSSDRHKILMGRSRSRDRRSRSTDSTKVKVKSQNWWKSISDNFKSCPM